MKLPRAENAIVDIEKLRGYCLNPDHPVGKHKARVFQSALGIATAHADFLRAELSPAAREKEAIPYRNDEFGNRFRVDFEIVRGRRNATVRSLWIIAQNAGARMARRR